MTATTAIARANTLRGMRSRSLVLLGVVGPLALGTVLALAFGGAGPTVSVGLLDLDGSEVSRSVTEELSGALADSPVDLETAEGENESDAMAERVDSADLGAVVVIPDGYAESVATLPDPPEPLVVWRAGGDGVAASVAEGLARQIASNADLQRAVVAGLVAAGEDPAGALVDGVEPVVAVAFEDFEEPFDAPLYFGPLTVFLFLGLGGTAKLLLRDERDGVLDRVRAAPVEGRSVLAGTGVAVMVQGAVAATVVILVSTLVFGATWGTPVEVAVVVGCFIFSVAGLLGVVVGIAHTELQAEGWTNVLAFGFALIGGSLFGGVLLPGVLGFVGLLTPNGAAMRALIEVGPGARSLADVWYLLVWMVVVGAAGTVVGARLMERRLR